MYLEPQAQWHIRDDRGRRKYLTAQERERFLSAADRSRPDIRALCYVVAFTGCRISEALALTPDAIDQDDLTIAFRTLKRRRTCFRSVPVPEALIALLMGLPTDRVSQRYWTMHRSTAWRHFKRLLLGVDVRGPMACCKGVRHSFGICAAIKSVPQNLIQRWMGHASPDTTAIYLEAVGLEERQFAGRMW